MAGWLLWTGSCSPAGLLLALPVLCGRPAGRAAATRRADTVHLLGRPLAADCERSVHPDRRLVRAPLQLRAALPLPAPLEPSAQTPATSAPDGSTKSDWGRSCAIMPLASLSGAQRTRRVVRAAPPTSGGSAVSASVCLVLPAPPPRIRTARRARPQPAPIRAALSGSCNSNGSICQLSELARCQIGAAVGADVSHPSMRAFKSAGAARSLQKLYKCAHDESPPN